MNDKPTLPSTTERDLVDAEFEEVSNDPPTRVDLLDGRAVEVLPLLTEPQWIFTFGPQHHYPGMPNESLARAFVRVPGTKDEARAKMVSLFGLKWGFQYESEEAAGVERFGLIELEVDFDAPPCKKRDVRRVLRDLMPEELREEYINDSTVHAYFQLGAQRGNTREQVLVAIVKAKTEAVHALTSQLVKAEERSLPAPVLLNLTTRYDALVELLEAVVAWRAQGAASRWHTTPSVALVHTIDRLRKQFPEWVELMVGPTPPGEPECPDCGMQMARYAGPEKGDSGFTCVKCQPTEADVVSRDT